MSEPTIETKWLGSLQGSIPEPVAVQDNLLIFNVLDAKLEGPRIKAKATGPSGDWVRVEPNGNWLLDVRLMMETDDGHPIYVFYNGVLRMTPELGERFASGEEIPGDQMYFRSAPYFRTNSEKYGWLNDIVGIGKMTSFGGGNVLYDLFEVL